MYLYKKLSSNIDIYTLTPIAKKVSDYKKSAMGEVEPEKQFVTVEKPDLTLVQSRDCKRVHTPNRKILASYYRANDQFGTTYKIKEGRDKYL